MVRAVDRLLTFALRPLPYNLAPRPMDDLAKTFIANDRSSYPQQSYMQGGQLSQVSQNGNADQQPQYQLSLNQPFMSGSDWAAATPAQLQQQQQTQAAFDQQIAQLNAMAQLGLSNPYQGERQGYGELNLNVSPAQAQTEVMNQSQMFTSPQYTSPAQDQQTMQYSLSSDGTISEPSRSGSQSAGNTMTPQQGFSFIPPLDPMTGQMLPGLDMDGGWTSMRAAGIDPIKKKRKTRACDRCNHSKTRCDSGSPCCGCRGPPCVLSHTEPLSRSSLPCSSPVLPLLWPTSGPQAAARFVHAGGQGPGEGAARLAAGRRAGSPPREH